MDQRIVGLTVSSTAEAKETLLLAARLQEEGLITVHDAAIITRLPNGRAEITSLDPDGVAGPPTEFGAVANDQVRNLDGQTVLALLVSDVAGMVVIEELRHFQDTPVVYARMQQKS